MQITGLILLIVTLLFISLLKNYSHHNSKKLSFSKVQGSLFTFPTTVLIGLILFSCGKKQVKPDLPKGYPVLTVEPQPTITFTDFPATMQGENIVEIRPMVDGYLEAIYVPEGAVVKKGQLLFKIKNPMYDQAVVTARAAIKIALADVNTAKMDVEKVRPLVDKEIVSKYELESAEFTLQSKQAAQAQAYATLANANTNLGYTTLHSPQNGVIGSIPYKIGALVSSTSVSPLTILANTGNVFAYFSWNEKQLLSFLSHRAGNTVQERLKLLPPVTLLLADGTEYPEKGKVETASGLISTETGTASLKAIFPNPKGILHSGASAVVRLNQTLNAALLVPQSASYELQDKRFVYTLTGKNMVMSRAIESVPTNDGRFLIVTNGLKKGDRVVLNGSNLKDSTLITPEYIKTDSVYSQLQKN